MPTLDQIRNAIAAKIAAVPDIGKVHEYERFAKGEKDFRTLYEHNGQIRGWNVRRLTKAENAPAQGCYNVLNKWRISGFLSLDDANQSEIVFDNLVEAVCDAFRADETLGGLIAGTVMDNPNVAGIQVEDSGPVMFAGVLCHSARLVLYTWHIRKG
jgi:hypothetical protein